MNVDAQTILSQCWGTGSKISETRISGRRCGEMEVNVVQYIVLYQRILQLKTYVVGLRDG